MREMTRSLLRFGWSMSLFGLRQTAYLARRPGWDRARQSLDAVSHAAAREMGEAVRSYYKAGDRFQSGLVDTAARLFSDSWYEPGQLMNEVWESLDRTEA